MMIQPDHSKARRRFGMLLAGTFLVGTLAATATPVLADPVAPPAPPAAPASPEMPQPPTPPAPPAPVEGIQTINISNDNGVHVARIVRDDGTTVILRTDHRLSDREIAAHVREAEQSRGEAEREVRRHRETSRVMIRRARDGVPSEAEIAAIVESARADARDAARASHDAARAHADAVHVRVNVERVRADAHREAQRALHRANAAIVTDCRGSDAARHIITRSIEDGDEEKTLRIVTCGNGSPALQLEAMRSARRALAEMDDEVLAAEHRASALTELDEEIADLEREIADRQN